ncbi:hypothetical protein TPHA_0D02470 [Tetrapisispora phaffii CBS 4417]|uniref:Serine/threonine-protein phosphatase n=1 Tax=Tetrapisispora phaffii (strain ATCC 24235 / CBS 4417 / NBRC 1672 / NRRL Y-8282 / UCD 70-5) TaxID=1071381 RepID=G8BSR3_TETPH|nr:hypothetical protein TPHA_0D02470 [Tetrapisispora phaffii CBS 4417]CCE62884.1 hypothetical protein TPHA_0D02470 [Tetrapisispora phaffii CBS 4417]
MGNSGSKPRKKGSGKANNAPPTTQTKPTKLQSKQKSSSESDSNKDTSTRNKATDDSVMKENLSRTETMQSTKSNRSLRSLRSKKSQTSISGNSNVDIQEKYRDDDHLPPRTKEIQRVHSSGSQMYSHSRSHSLSRVPTDVQSNKSNNNLLPGINSGRADSRKSSFNGSYDIPPSMIQVKPKSPILRNRNYTSSSVSSFQENAITDDENDDSNNNIAYSNSRKRVDILRHSHSSGTSRGSPFASRSRRKSDNSVSENDLSPGADHLPMHSMSRTGSHNSMHSRRSSTNSVGTNTFVTPMNSPGIKITDTDQERNDYFSHSNDSNNYRYNNETGLDIQNNQYIGDHSSELAGEAMYFPNADNSYDALHSTSHDRNINDDSTISKKKKSTKMLDIDETIQKLLDAGYASKRTKNVCLKNSEIAQICQRSREIFLSQPPLLELSPPVKIVGDVHGQYGDLLRLFTKCGFPPSSNYLFLGDYVDRGKQSLETILLLLCYKIKYPENFFLLRGNHECANVTRVYGFYDECKRRCNIKTWKVFVDTFNTLPLAAIVTGKIFCVHGGLSPVLNSMDEIRHVSRPTDIPDFGLINDLLWSDPTDSPNEWEDNERGVSYCYNKVAINKFLNKFDFDLVCRAHMVVEDGYEFFNDRSLVTVFSAPNYCGEFDNWGAVMSVNEGLLCSFELLDPLDSVALKQVMKKGRHERKFANQQQQQYIQN